jgi:GNAT superfamily N-acetyltransferase
VSGDDVAVRRMGPDDADALLEWAHGEGWAYDWRDVERFLGLGGGYVAEADGEAVGILTASVYGPLAWVGNVIVPPERRNRGIGGATLEAALADLEDRGVETVRLYAVGGAVSLYQRVGFEAQGNAVSLAGRGRPGEPGLPRVGAGDLDEVAAFDEAVFGASREPLLADLVASDRDEGVVYREDGEVRGYAFVKGGDEVAEIGPAVGPGDPRESGVAEGLVESALALAGDRPVEVGVRGAHPLARALFTARGFEEAFPATAMRWGRDAHGGEPERVVAVGGMGKG